MSKFLFIAVLEFITTNYSYAYEVYDFSTKTYFFAASCSPVKEQIQKTRVTYVPCESTANVIIDSASCTNLNNRCKDGKKYVPPVMSQSSSTSFQLKVLEEASSTGVFLPAPPPSKAKKEK